MCLGIVTETCKKNPHIFLAEWKGGVVGYVVQTFVTMTTSMMLSTSNKEDLGGSERNDKMQAVLAAKYS